MRIHVVVQDADKQQRIESHEFSEASDAWEALWYVCSKEEKQRRRQRNRNGKHKHLKCIAHLHQFVELLQLHDVCLQNHITAEQGGCFDLFELGGPQVADQECKRFYCLQGNASKLSIVHE